MQSPDFSNFCSLLILTTFYSQFIPAWMLLSPPPHTSQKTISGNTRGLSDLSMKLCPSWKPAHSSSARCVCVSSVSLLQSWAGVQGVDPVPPACEEETGNCVWTLANPDSLCDISSFILIRWQTKNEKIFHWWHFSVILHMGTLCCVLMYTL